MIKTSSTKEAINYNEEETVANITFQERLNLAGKSMNIFMRLEKGTNVSIDDIFNLKFKDITESKFQPNKYILKYYSTKKNKIEKVEIGVYLKALIDTYKMECVFTCGFVNEHIFYDYYYGKLNDSNSFLPF